MSLGLIIHAVVLAVAFLSIAYLVYATAQKSEGVLKSIGTILAGILAAIGALVLIGHLSAPMTGGRPFGIEMGPSAVTTTATTTASGSATTSDATKPSEGDAAGAAPSNDETGGGKP